MYYTIFLKGSNYNPEAGDYSPNVIQCIMYKELSQDPAIVENPAWWMSGKHILINILLFSFYFLPFLIRDRQRQTERSPFSFLENFLSIQNSIPTRGMSCVRNGPLRRRRRRRLFSRSTWHFFFPYSALFRMNPDTSRQVDPTHTHNVSIRSKIVQLITPPRTGK